MIAVQECLRFWERNSLIINLWNPENLEHAVRTVKFMGHVRLSGTVAKEAKKIPVVNYVFSMMIV